MQCPNCKSKIPKEANFCPNCRFKLKEGVETGTKSTAIPNINISPDIRVEGGGKVEFSPKISLSSYRVADYTSNDELTERIDYLESELENLTKTRPDIDQPDINQLEEKYSKEDVVKILEAFRILLRMREMTDKDCYPWEYKEQLDLLGRYLDFNQNLTKDLEEEIRKITVATEPNQKVSVELSGRLKRAVNDILDVWVSEFLR